MDDDIYPLMEIAIGNAKRKGIIKYNTKIDDFEISIQKFDLNLLTSLPDSEKNTKNNVRP